MPRLLALSGGPSDAEALDAVAAVLGHALHLEVTHEQLPEEPEQVVRAVLRATDSPGVQVAVLPSGTQVLADAVAELMLCCPKPVVLVPVGRTARRPATLSRVLAPLDGTEESAAGVAGTLSLLAASGVDLVVLHVFEEATVPRFWDQPVHARHSWESEFLARFCPEPGARLELRSGRPGAGILDVAESEGADLIALGWSQPSEAGRGATVHETVRGARVPVLLLPVGPAEGAR